MLRAGGRNGTMNNTVVHSPALLGVTVAGALLIAIIGTSGNLLAVVALLQSKKLRLSPSTAFMVNMPACLLPVCTIGMPLYAIGCLQMKYYHQVLFPESFSVAVFTIGLILSQVHLHTICALAFNRLLAVKWPVMYKRLMQRRKVRVYLVLVWTYSALLWLPLAFGALGGLKFDERELMVSMDKTHSRALKGLHVFFTYMLPILFASTCYVIMYVKVRYSRSSRNVRACRKSVATPEEDAVRQWDDHVTRTILVIFIILVSCCVPHLVVHMRHLYDQHQAAWLLLHLVFWLQFCLDPIVYVTVSRQYRAACIDTICGLLRRLGLSRWIQPSVSTSISSIDPPAPKENVFPEVMASHNKTPKEPTNRSEHPSLTSDDKRDELE